MLIKKGHPASLITKGQAAPGNNQRAYSLLSVKSIDEEKREITGIATTPAADSVGDIVEPDGAEYKLPIPLLWQHDPMQPIGEVYAAKSTKNGIEIKARLVKVSAPSQLAARLDEAWQSIKTGLVKGLSIGFRPLEYAFLDEGGIKFTRWIWHELSAVTIPANSEANIATVKSADADMLAAIGSKAGQPSVIKPPAGVTAKKSTTVKLTPKEGNNMNYLEQIKKFLAERAAKAAKQAEIMSKANETGETLDDAQSEEFETLDAEIKAIDKHVVRLKSLQANAEADAAAAKPVEKANNMQGASDARSGVSVVSVKSDLPAGVAMARVVKCLGVAKGNYMAAEQIARETYKDDPRIGNVLKAAVAAGSTTNAAWAGNLVSTEGGVYADFVEFLRPQTILGKFGVGGIPSLRQVPFNVPLLGQTTGGAGYWVGEGAAKPVTKFDFSRTHLSPLKVANIAVVTEELLRSSSPNADLLVRDGLVAALKERLDLDFIDPAKVAVSGVSPASITNGVTPVASSGTDAAAVRCDIAALFANFIAANNPASSAVLILSATNALAIATMRNALGAKEFPDMNISGGFIDGIPTIVSEYVPTDSSGSLLIMVNASDIYIGDEGGFQVDISREASLQMLDNPTNNAIGSTAPTTLVSLWQTNTVGFRAERIIDWMKRRATAVSYVEGAAYSICE